MQLLIIFCICPSIKLTQNFLSSTSHIKPANKPVYFTLYQNYPNPFNGCVFIPYSLNQNTYVSISIYDLNAHKLKVLVDEIQNAGEHKIQWDGTNLYGEPLDSGMYLYELTASKQKEVRKMILAQ